MFISQIVLSGISRRRKRSGETGMSLIELLISMTVLCVGMLGSMLLIVICMQTNSRSKTDTSSTVLDQEILEKFATLKNYPKSGTVTITDCGTTANSHLASLVQGASPSGNGAVLYTASTAPTPGQIGDVDWSQATPTLATATTAGYAMRYQTCTGDAYEVRWNITQLPACGSLSSCSNPTATSRISLLTVSSEQVSAVSVGSAGANNAVLFARPTTLRSLFEN